MIVKLNEFGPFDSVLDVGGNIGEFAEHARALWPAARITSFEPLAGAANANRERARGRWWVEECALSSVTGAATIRFCVNQHPASTMQEPGPGRRERWGIVDRFEQLWVMTRRLDEFADVAGGRCLVKVDVEGHELEVLAGGDLLLDQVACVVCEVNQDPRIFVGAPSPAAVDAELRRHGLFFAGILGVQVDPAGELVQFDGAWVR